VYQEVNLCPNLSIAENIYIGREPRRGGRIDWKAINRQAAALMERFNIHIDVTRSLDSYSTAIQQLAAIARAVDISARVLILDEPTSSLTVAEVRKLFEIMRMLRAQGMGVIFVTHFLDQVYEVSDRITVLRGGKYVGTFEAAELPRIQLVGKMIGKEYSEVEVERDAASAAKGRERGAPLLELRGVSGAGTVREVSLSVGRGEVFGFSGLLGSGRSEIARLIFGADRVESGEIALGGKPAGVRSPIDAIRKGVAFCPEDRKAEGVVGELSIRDNIILALQSKRGMTRAISRAEAERITDEYIKKLNIKTPSQNQLIRNLSGGNQQKVIVARWLATDPDLLILDEPTRGIDIGAKAEIQKIVVRLAKEDMAVIFISSEIDEMLRCCGRMAVLRDRRVVAELEGADISEAAVMEYIAGGAQ
jgi:simple sugar transport system ATP-binding protein